MFRLGFIIFCIIWAQMAFSSTLVLPSPKVIMPVKVIETAPEKRKFIRTYIEAYVKEYTKQFLRLNSITENKFSEARIVADLNATYETKRDAQIMAVNQDDVTLLKHKMDELAVRLYLQSDLVARFGADIVDSTVRESIGELKNEISKLKESINITGQNAVGVKNGFKQLQTRLDSTEAKLAALEPKLRALSSQAPQNNLTAPAPAAPVGRSQEFYIAVTAIVVSLGSLVLNQMARK